VRALSPAANCWNDGPRSGIERQIIGNIGPLASAWWSPENNGSGMPGSQIAFEPRVGGRVYERTAQGIELEWGEVTVWQPPRRLCYRWHIRADRSDATDVEIIFHELPDASTRVPIRTGGTE